MSANTSTAENISILDIRCPSCGAPARFDIIEQIYLCSYCGSKITVRDANLQIHGFRSIRSGKLRDSVRLFHLSQASCTGCGAAVVFEESEALTSCAFCGSSMVRKDYVSSEDMPESVIPFALTKEEAEERLLEWCRNNSSRPEARHLKKITGKLKGFYLPYEMVRGPVHMKAARMDGGGTFRCEGCMNSEVINRSRQLDNLLLDGMEPYDFNAMKEFDFGYVAGQHVKISDLPEESLEARVRQETSVSYKPYIRKVLQTKAVYVSSDVSSAIRLPVLLPAYYISEGQVAASVNGQTGKVSVRAEKESHYYFLPWWLKAIVATILISAAAAGGLMLFGMSVPMALYIAGLLAIVMIIIMLCLFSDYSENTFAVKAGRKIFTSGDTTFHRERDGLVPDDEVLMRRVEEPVFYYKTGKQEEKPAVLKFVTPGRIVRMVLLTLGMLFLPVLIALLLNGFNFDQLELGGSAVWFCIMVPVVPVWLIKYGILDLYERPMVWLLQKDGSKKRYHNISGLLDKDTLKIIFELMLKPPMCFAFWIAVAVFCAMCWWTAFGFGV